MWAEHVLRDPDWMQPDRLAFGRIPEAHGQILRVIYTKMGNHELATQRIFRSRSPEARAEGVWPDTGGIGNRSGPENSL